MFYINHDISDLSKKDTIELSNFWQERFNTWFARLLKGKAKKSNKQTKHSSNSILPSFYCWKTATPHVVVFASNNFVLRAWRGMCYDVPTGIANKSWMIATCLSEKRDVHHLEGTNWPVSNLPTKTWVPP